MRRGQWSRHCESPRPVGPRNRRSSGEAQIAHSDPFGDHCCCARLRWDRGITGNGADHYSCANQYVSTTHGYAQSPASHGHAGATNVDAQSPTRHGYTGATNIDAQSPTAHGHASAANIDAQPSASDSDARSITDRYSYSATRYSDTHRGDSSAHPDGC